MVHPAALPAHQLLEQCTTRRRRRSGPGGQHRNKVETAVVITHDPSAVQGEASERRSQHENHQVALFRLRVNLALSVREPREPAAAPSPLWQTRCRRGRVAVNPAHEDFPTLLAEALDVLAGHAWDVAAAAATLSCTSSQLTKFLKLESRALQQLNEQRQQRQLRPLR